MGGEVIDVTGKYSSSLLHPKGIRAGVAYTQEQARRFIATGEQPGAIVRDPYRDAYGIGDISYAQGGGFVPGLGEQFTETSFTMAPPAGATPVAPGGEPVIGGLVVGAIGAGRIALWLVRLAGPVAALAARMGTTVAKIVPWLSRNVWAVAKVAGWVAAGVWLADVLNLPSDEEAQLAVLQLAALGEPKKRRRYTIGSNPRVRTLQKVARHTMKLLKRHKKYIDEFFPKTSRRGELAARERAHHRLIGKAV